MNVKFIFHSAMYLIYICIDLNHRKIAFPYDRTVIIILINCHVYNNNKLKKSGECGYTERL